MTSYGDDHFSPTHTHTPSIKVAGLQITMSSMLVLRLLSICTCLIAGSDSRK